MILMYVQIWALLVYHLPASLETITWFGSQLWRFCKKRMLAKDTWRGLKLLPIKWWNVWGQCCVHSEGFFPWTLLGEYMLGGGDRQEVGEGGLSQLACLRFHVCFTYVVGCVKQISSSRRDEWRGSVEGERLGLGGCFSQLLNPLFLGAAVCPSVG